MSAIVKNTDKLVKMMDLGKMSYTKCIGKMESIVEKQLCNMEEGQKNYDTLMLTEHDPTYTVGMRELSSLGHDEKERLESLRAKFIVSTRGGLITFHGPGQLVAYPVLNLRRFDNLPIKEYVYKLEQVGINCCQKYGLNAKRTEHVGVWLENNKIASIGVRNQRMVTSHGMSFNVNTDLKWYNHIVACGLFGKGTTSLSKELGKELDFEQFKTAFVDEFEKVFDCVTF